MLIFKLGLIMNTPLSPRFQKRINDSFEQVIKNQVTPWVFLNSGKPFKIEAHGKRQISHEGISFEGSPERIFWSSYIEPFIEEIVINELDSAVKMAKEREVDLAILLPEIEMLLTTGISKTFSAMADIDRRLKGKGYPEKIQLRSVENEISRMDKFVAIRIQAERDMWNPRSRQQKWYERNKFTIWIIGKISILIKLFG